MKKYHFKFLRKDELGFVEVQQEFATIEEAIKWADSIAESMGKSVVITDAL